MEWKHKLHDKAHIASIRRTREKYWSLVKSNSVQDAEDTTLSMEYWLKCWELRVACYVRLFQATGSEAAGWNFSTW